MNKYIFVISLIFVFSPSFAQQSENSIHTAASSQSIDAIFRNAIQSGRLPGQPFEETNIIKSLTEDKLRSLANQDNIRIIDIKTKQIKRFGDYTNMVDKFVFLPEADIEQLNLEILVGDGQSVPDVNSTSNLAYVYFYNEGASALQKIRMHWSSSENDGYAQGDGLGVAAINGTYYAVKGHYSDGYLEGQGVYIKDRTDNRITINTGRFIDGMSIFKIGEKFGYIDQKTLAEHPDYLYFSTDPNWDVDRLIAEYGEQGDYFVMLNSDNEEIKVSKSGVTLGYSDKQEKINEERCLEEERKAEEARRAELARKQAEEAEAARIKAEAERLAAYRDALIKKNSNYKLWEVGDRLCHSYPSDMEKVIMVTLEEWNDTRNKAKVRVVASPSSTSTYKGELLEKNNTFWIDTKEDGWYLAWPEEIDKALETDRSAKDNTPVYIQSSSSSSSSSSRACSSCGGRGRVVCSSCNGTGWYEDSWGSDSGVCSSCHGSGYHMCYSCNGTGID